MVGLLKGFDSKKYSPLVFVVAGSDTTSRPRVEAVQVNIVYNPHDLIMTSRDFDSQMSG